VVEVGSDDEGVVESIASGGGVESLTCLDSGSVELDMSGSGERLLISE